MNTFPNFDHSLRFDSSFMLTGKTFESKKTAFLESFFQELV